MAIKSPKIQKSKRGGRREGAGRPIIGNDKRVLMTARVDLETKQKIEKKAKKRGISRGLLIDEIVKKW